MDVLKTISLYLLVVVYVAAGINHFRNPKFYLRLMPQDFPAPQLLNHASGIAEIMLGLLLLHPATRSFAAWAIALMLLLFTWVHINMLQQSLRQPSYFMRPAAAWLRLLLQPLLIAWVLWHTR